MAWCRVPRSLRTYLVVGLIITVSILTFSTSRMIRVDASDPRSAFPFLMISNKQSNMGTTVPYLDQSSLGSSIGASSADSALSASSQQLPSSLLQHNNNHHQQQQQQQQLHLTDESKLDIHTINLSGAQSQAALRKQETQGDTIVISPYSSSSSSSSSFNPATSNTFDDSTMSRIVVQAFNASNRHPSGGQPTTSTRQPVQSLIYFPPFNSSASTSTFLSAESRISNQDAELANQRRNFIRDMMRHAWQGYHKYAWGYNEVRPVSKLPHTESVFGGEPMGATIVDAIDTLYIMGLHDEYLAARSWIEEHLDFDKFDSDLSVFETNIRYVGGLLSIYALTKDQMFLNKAVQLADKLLPAFDTPSGIPYSNVNLKTGYARNHDWAYGSAILSEFGSMQLEFIYLSHVTGDPRYREKVLKVREVIKKAIPRSDGLYNNYMNTDSGQWLTRPTHVSMGALGDSFYEYLIKSYVQSDGADLEAYQLYMNSIKAFENKLLFTSTQSRLVYFAELKDTSISHKMDSLACFSGGMLALGATKSQEPVRSHHMALATGLANTCHEACIRTTSHLPPESFVFTNRADAQAYNPSDKYYILRPEILETWFYMWRFTHDSKYRDWSWDFVEALESYCKAEGGYSGIRNVYQPMVNIIKDDVQQSFFLAEVLKYLYLTFSDDNTISLNDWVLNTEAHPLPILRQL